MSFLKRYWKSLLVAVAILYLSLWKQPSFRMPDISNADKWAHMLMYAGLAFMAHWDLHTAKIKNWKLYFFGVIVPIVYGGVIEILQEQFFKPRSGEWGDWLADGLGAVAGFIVFPYALRLWEKFMDKHKNHTPHA